MYDHVGLKAADIAASAAVYAAALAPLGHVTSYEDAEGAGFGPRGAPALWLHRDTDGTGPRPHVAFAAATRAAVDTFHAAGLAAGGRDNGGPGLRVDYGANYYAAFLFDPDGTNVEAVCLAEQG